jgi:hypothetical protein
VLDKHRIVVAGSALFLCSETLQSPIRKRKLDHDAALRRGQGNKTPHFANKAWPSQ